jgi:hypothetical protein
MCGGKRCVCRDLVGKPEGKRPLRKPRHKWPYKIKYALNGMDSTISIHVVQDRDNWWVILKTVMSLRVPKNAGKILID